MAPTDRKMLSKSATEFDESNVLNASEKDGQDFNTFNKSAVRGKYDPADYNFDLGVPNKGTP